MMMARSSSNRHGKRHDAAHQQHHSHHHHHYPKPPQKEEEQARLLSSSTLLSSNSTSAAAVIHAPPPRDSLLPRTSSSSSTYSASQTYDNKRTFNSYPLLKEHDATIPRTGHLNVSKENKRKANHAVVTTTIGPRRRHEHRRRQPYYDGCHDPYHDPHNTSQSQSQPYSLNDHCYNYPCNNNSNNTTSIPIPFSPFECSYQPLGLQLYKVQLPTCFFPLLHDVLCASDAHASTLPHGWRTKYYSLTEQDVPLSHIPHLNIQPLYDYLRDCMQYLFVSHHSYNNNNNNNNDNDNNNNNDDNNHSTPIPQSHIVMDAHQPHVLKYSVADQHVGMELHRDKCDITCNLMLSSTSDYTGGGTWIPAIGKVVRLNFGEFLLHPGSLLHAGVDITSGCRYLMILFAHFENAAK